MKKIRRRTVTAVLTALSLSGALAVPALADESFRTLDEIRESGTVNIGVFSDKSPFGYVDENGEYQGYDLYLYELLGEDLWVEIKYFST